MLQLADFERKHPPVEVGITLQGGVEAIHRHGQHSSAGRLGHDHALEIAVGEHLQFVEHQPDRPLGINLPPAASG